MSTGLLYGSWGRAMIIQGARVLLAAVVLSAVLLPAQDLNEQTRAIAGKLMAPCCWAEPVSQHLSPVAEEMRGEIRSMLAAGKSEQEILDFYVAKHGVRILARPPARGFNLLAYVLPPVFAVAGTLVLILALKRLRRLRVAGQPAGTGAQPLDDRYAERIEKELRDLD